MLISRRRLQVALLGGLGVVAIGLLAPARERMLAWMAGRWIGENVHVARAAIFPGRSFVLIDGLEFTTSSQGWESRLEIPQCWLLTDPRAMRHGVVAVARAQCDDVRLRVQPAVQVPGSEASAGGAGQVQDWHVLLAQCLATIDWQSFRSQCQSLVAADHLNTTWNKRINRWLSRSHEIMNEVRSINARAVQANPLRDTEKITQDLARAQRLLAEQQELVEQFGGLQRLLDAEAGQLAQRFEEELGSLEQAALDGSLGSASDNRRWAQTLVELIAAQRWRHLRPITAASIHLPLCVAPRGWNDAEPAIEVAADRWLDVRRCCGSGIAELPSGAIPLAFESSWSGTYRRAAPELLPRSALLDQWWPGGDAETRWVVPVVQTDWTLQFGTESDRLVVRSHRTLPGPDVQVTIEGHVQEPRQEISPSDTVFGQSADRVEPNGSRQVLLGGTGSATELDLWVSIHQSDVEGVLGPMTAVDPASDESSVGQPVRVKVAGTWENPEFVCESAIPPWLIQAVADRVRQLSARRLASEKARLRDEFRAQMEHTARLIQTVAQQGQQVMLDHHRQLAALGESLRIHRDALSETEFARRPTDRVTR